MEPEHENENIVDVYRTQRQQAATKRLLYGASATIAQLREGAGALEPHERLLMRPIIATEKDVGTDILQRLAEYGIVKKDL